MVGEGRSELKKWKMENGKNPRNSNEGCGAGRE